MIRHLSPRQEDPLPIKLLTLFNINQKQLFKILMKIKLWLIKIKLIIFIWKIISLPLASLFSF